jgi:hypothetical protein
MFLTLIFWRKCVQIYIADIQHFTLNINKVVIIFHIHKYLKTFFVFFCRLKARFFNRMLLMLRYTKLWIDSALLISESHKSTVGAIVIFVFIMDINIQFSQVVDMMYLWVQSSTVIINIHYYFLSISWPSHEV